ncbi:MAG TPA: hypothetical protein VGW34_13370 [Allosphingosinicella sp.]|nr:hypothetical protein [Allosphingosinicella sp.]
MTSKPCLVAAVAAGWLLAACGKSEPEPAPGELEKFVAKIEAESKVEQAELVEAARAREEERARESEERLRQLETAPPAALESAVKGMNR